MLVFISLAEYFWLCPFFGAAINGNHSTLIWFYYLWIQWSRIDAIGNTCRIIFRTTAHRHRHTERKRHAFYLAWHVIYRQYPFHFSLLVMWYMKSICIRIRFRMKIKLSKHTHTHRAHWIFVACLWRVILGTSIAAMGTIHKEPYQESSVGVCQPPFVLLLFFPFRFLYSINVELRCERMQWNCFRWIYDIKYERIDFLNAYVH